MPCSFMTKDGNHFCQFNIHDIALIKLSDNTQWCEFHCPVETIENKQLVKTEKANWTGIEVTAYNDKIISKIKAGAKDQTYTNLAGVIFPNSIDFSGLDIFTCNLSETIFYGDTKFYEAKFIGKANFNNTTFNGDAYFNGSKFNYTTVFDEAEFSGYSGFNETYFCKYATFEKTIFIGFANFTKSRFSEGAMFGAASFGADVKFNEVVFNESTNFKDTQFNGFAEFKNVSFNGPVTFWNTIFRNIAGFMDVKFGGDVYFKYSIFDSDAEFKNVKFIKNVEFTGGYKSNNYFNNISFKGAEFLGKCYFNNRKFRHTTDFSYSIFMNSPAFHNCELHQDTRFKEVKFKDTHSEDAARDYRTLKLAMEQHRSRDEQSRFYAYEQQSLRNQPKTPYWVKLSSFIYEFTSDYGRSALRPLIGLLLVIFSFRLLYSYPLMYHVRIMHGSELWRYTIQQIVSPFSSLSHKNSELLESIFGENLLFVQFLSVIQSILGLTFIALFLLAIRWKFMRG